MTEVFPCELPRLVLRALRPNDLDPFHAYRSDPQVARYQGWAPMSREAAASYLDAQAGHAGPEPGTWSQLAIAMRDTDLLIGDMGVFLSPQGTHAELGISITPAAQGHGYGTEAVRGLIERLFTRTGVTRVEACSDVRNGACLAVLSRAGLSLVETRQEEYKGELCTEQVYAIVRAA